MYPAPEIASMQAELGKRFESLRKNSAPRFTGRKRNVEAQSTIPYICEQLFYYVPGTNIEVEWLPWELVALHMMTIESFPPMIK